jgi:hypothetical protein
MQVANWKAAVAVKAQTPVTAAPAVHPMVAKLRAAADVWDHRTGNFALGKADTCRDMAAKLERFGSFVSEAQKGYADKLVAWAAPRAQDAVALKADTPKLNPDDIATPALFAVMQKHATFHVNGFKITRRNQDSLCWIVYGDRGAVGKIDNGTTNLWFHKARNAGADIDVLRALIAELEANPLVAAMKYGKLSGRCCSCGRDITHPDSIDAGMGPVCRAKFD